MRVQQKALAYITRGTRLLVFSQPHSPEAGIQVPGGSLEDGEDPASGVLREAREETGLTALRLDVLLGEQMVDLPERALLMHRHVFHLICEQATPDRWQHHETDPSEGPYQPIPFDFFWVDLRSGLPLLVGQQGALLPMLRRHLKLSE
jgi:8-oxo-dGTP pyrophosphatase MutT (NUDIX family)